MSEMSENARAAMKAKAATMVKGDPHQKIGATTWSPPEMLGADKQIGARVLSKRAFKAGGRVAHILGEKSKARADRSARASGGKAMTADSYINRDVKEANLDRDGFKHVGGWKKGGKVAHPKGCYCKMCNGGAMASGGTPKNDPYAEDDDYVTKGKVNGGGIKMDSKAAVTDHDLRQMRSRQLKEASIDYNPESVNKAIASSRQKIGGKEAKMIHALLKGRTGRKSGGRTKGKTNINIIIGAGKGQQDPSPMMNAPVRNPVPPPPIVPPVAGPPPMAGGMPPMGAGGPPMMRKAGGRAMASGGKLLRYIKKSIGSKADDYESGRNDKKLLNNRNKGINLALDKIEGKAKVPARAPGGKATHVIDNAAGGGKGRLQKISAYGLKP